MEFADQEKSVVTGNAGQVEVLGKDQDQQDGQREKHLLPREGRLTFFCDKRKAGVQCQSTLIPPGHTKEDDDPSKSAHAKPYHVKLTIRYNDQSGQQRTYRASRIPSQL